MSSTAKVPAPPASGVPMTAVSSGVVFAGVHGALSDLNRFVPNPAYQKATPATRCSVAQMAHRKRRCAVQPNGDYLMSTATAVREASFNQAKADAFVGQLVGALNSSALMLMTSVGHRTGLFESLAKISPCTTVDSPRRPTSPNVMCANGWRS